MDCAALISFNSWYASSMIELLDRAKIKTICVLTDPNTRASIEKVIIEPSKSLKLLFFYDLTTICDYLNTFDKVLFVFDHPLRRYEIELVRSVKAHLTIIEMEHGLSVARGKAKYKKYVSNFLRRLVFMFVTRKGEVRRIKEPKASGLIYLYWLNLKKNEIINAKQKANTTILFATSGAGRYRDKKFQSDTREALSRAGELSEFYGKELCILVKNGENLSYLGNDLDRLRVVSGGLLCFLQEVDGAANVICHDQSTIVREAAFLGLTGWTYHARFAERSAYSEPAGRKKIPGCLTKLEDHRVEGYELGQMLKVRQKLLQIMSR